MGLGASIYNGKCIKANFSIEKAVHLLTHDISHRQISIQLLSMLNYFPEKAKKTNWRFLAQERLTIVLPKQKNKIPNQTPFISAGKERVAVRMPNHQMTKELIQLVGPLQHQVPNPYGNELVQLPQIN